MNNIGKGIATIGLCALGCVVAIFAPDHLKEALPVVSIATIGLWVFG